jgi:hypothetical protein
MQTVLEGYPLSTSLAWHSLIITLEHLGGSEWDKKEIIEHATQHFERSGKRKVNLYNTTQVPVNNIDTL